MNGFRTHVLLFSLVGIIGCASDQQENSSTNAEESQVSTEEEQVPLTAQGIAANAFPSVVLLSMSDRNGQPLSMGSGFFVGGDLIATNAHVVEGASSGFAKPVDGDTNFRIQGITGVDQERDIVVLQVDGTGPVLSLNRARSVVGQKVYAIGNPRGLEGTFSEGIVSSVRPIGTDTLLQITAPISPGSSGGPILNDSGEVIGIATASFSGGQNLNFAVPSKYLGELLDRGRSLTPLSGASVRSAGRSIFSNIGRPLTTGVSGENFQWDIAYDLNGDYSLSFRNRLNQPVRNLYALVIFHDRRDEPVETDLVRFRDAIPAGLARRVSSTVDKSIKRLTTNMTNSVEYEFTPITRIEVRILGFEVIE